MVRFGQSYEICVGLFQPVNGRIKSPNGATKLSHGLLKGPIVGDPEGVNEAVSITDVVVQTVKADKFVTVNSPAMVEPLAAEILADGAHGLQGHADGPVKLLL